MRWIRSWVTVLRTPLTTRAGADDRLKQGRRPDAELGRAADDGFGRGIDCDPGALCLLAADSETETGRGLRDLHVAERTLPRKRSSCTAAQDWLPKGYKNWDALLTDAVRKGMKHGKAPADLAHWTLWKLARGGYRTPAGPVSAVVGRVAGTGEQPLSGDTTTVKQVGRDFGPSQRFTMDWSDMDGSTENIVLGESGDPYSAYFRDQWSDYYAGTDVCAAVQRGCGGGSDTAYATIAAMKRQGFGIGNREEEMPGAPGSTGPGNFSLGSFRPAIILLAAAIAVAPELVHGNSCGHDFDFHLVSWLDCLNSWRHGIPYPHWTAAANYGAGETRFVFYPPLTWMAGRSTGSGSALEPGSGGADVPYAGGQRPGNTRTSPDGNERRCRNAGRLRGAFFRLHALLRLRAHSIRGAFRRFWIPLLLLFALHDGEGNPSGSPVRRAFNGSAAPLALVVAGTWLSNVPLGVMATYLLAAVALAAALLKKSWAPVVRALVAAAVGIGLAGIYLFPAAFGSSTGSMSAWPSTIPARRSSPVGFSRAMPTPRWRLTTWCCARPRSLPWP